LVDHVTKEKSEFVLLPEMPFSTWLAQDGDVDPARWQASVDEHDRWMPRLDELLPAVVAGTRPVIIDGKRLNVGFLYEGQSGYQAVHQKYYLPNEAGYWEAAWYQRGDGDFSLGEAKGVRAGFLICTEMWFSAHARQYAKDGIHLLLCPRATPGTTADKWVAGGRAAAVVSGAYCLSSNFSGACRSYPWAGTGWIIEPQEGAVLGTTSKENPFLTLDIDLHEAETAKSTFPRYVPD
jgi:N-carbamoylputrescine amidase